MTVAILEMAAQRLEMAAQRLLAVSERRRHLGGFDANAEDFLILCDTVLAVIDHLMEAERIKREVFSTPPMRGPNVKARKK